MHLEVTLGSRKLTGQAAHAELEKALSDAEECDALWWRDGREGPFCVYVRLPSRRSGRYRGMSLSHSSWPQLKKDLKALGLESTIKRAEVKVAAGLSRRSA